MGDRQLPILCGQISDGLMTPDEVTACCSHGTDCRESGAVDSAHVVQFGEERSGRRSRVKPPSRPMDLTEPPMSTDLSEIDLELMRKQFSASPKNRVAPVSYTHLRAHETDSYLVCRLLLEKKNDGPYTY